MMTGKEYLKEHIGETNIPEEHYENEIGEIMDWYADDYHQEQVKNLSLSGVSQQSELLAFRKWQKDNWKDVYLYSNEFMIREFKKANCG